MPSITDIPSPFLSPGQKDTLIEWLNLLPVTHLNRKELLHKWGAMFHVELSASDYNRLTKDIT